MGKVLDEMEQYAIVQKDFLEFYTFVAMRVVNSTRDVNEFGESAASVKDGAFHAKILPQFQDQVDLALKRGWLVEDPDRKGWYRINDNKE